MKFDRKKRSIQSKNFHNLPQSPRMNHFRSFIQCGSSYNFDFMFCRIYDSNVENNSQN
ncbi:hypothetical protein LEP1GSC172_0213 [Leptospira noguchii]|uniref:Uncharacterized protein n=1 Tax=Leptospira noguchii TaxID=28182 RepID=M6VG87_9LEPT|nr:hypothetical protein LEP1GSC172_0213 [Leptospira noguchii]